MKFLADKLAADLSKEVKKYGKREVAAKVGCSYATIDRVTSKNPPRMHTLCLLLDYLGKSVNGYFKK